MDYITHRLNFELEGADVDSIKKLPWMGSTRRTSIQGNGSKATDAAF